MDSRIDEDDRPTLPTLSRATPRFDRETQLFFDDVPTLPEFRPMPPEDVAAWWAEQRRRGFVRWVASAMAVCAGILAAAVVWS